MNQSEIAQFVQDTIKYKDWEFHVNDKNGTIYVQIQFMASDNMHGQVDSPPERQYCRKWQLSEYMTRTEIVETCYKAVRMAEEHELKELFLYKGVPIYNTHTDVDKMAELQHDGALDMRSSAKASVSP